MDKIILNIDSNYRNKNIYLLSSNFNINLYKYINNKINYNYIKIIDMKIFNNICFINNNKNNNFFIIKGIFIGPPQGPDVFTLPIEDVIIILDDLIDFNIDNIINNINLTLNRYKFNEFNNDKITKGIYFSLENNKIKITNLSNHYTCNITWESNIGNYLGFVNKIYNINTRSSIYSEKIYNIYDEYIFLQIENKTINFNNIYININNNIQSFSKLDYKDNYYILNQYINNTYYNNNIISLELSELFFKLLDKDGNNLTSYQDFTFIIEIGYYNQL